MPQVVPIQAIPNQQFSIALGGAFYDISINEARGIMAVGIKRNNVTIIEGIRMVSGSPVIPSKYQEDGNFMMVTNNFELPHYTGFGVRQFLIYFSVAELEALRQPVAAPVNETFFDPIAALPQRFKPLGYKTA